MAEVLILGAGMAGLSAAWHSRQYKRDTLILESRNRWGGLLDHFVIDGFRFDRGVHLAFSSHEEYLDLLKKTDHFIHYPQPYNYEAGRWLKHPVQNNLFFLPVEEKVEALKSFIERPKSGKIKNYRQWLTGQYGEYIADRFPVRYTKKYWTVSADKLSTDWIGNRLYRPKLDEVLYGAMTDQTPSTYYLPEMYYPKSGGYRSFLNPLREGLAIRTGKKVTQVNSKHKYVECADGSREYYEYLVSSLPLPELITMLDGVPAIIKDNAAGLWATSVALVSLALGKPQAGEHLWFYIYDQGILPARVHAPHLKSGDNVPTGCSSLQFEIYFSRHAPLELSSEELTEHVVSAAVKMNLFTLQELICSDFRVLPYAFVAFDHKMIKRRDMLLQHLKEREIISIGRFGEWDYLWADQCFMSGKKVLNLPGVL